MYVYVCVCVCMYVCVYVCMYVYMYVLHVRIWGFYNKIAIASLVWKIELA